MAVTIQDREVTTKDSSEVFKYTFDYDDALEAGVELASIGTVTITPATGAPTQAFNALVVGNRAVTVFLSAGTVGRIFTIEHTVQTNENPPQTFSPWFKLRIT
jgi:hypothetical protein